MTQESTTKPREFILFEPCESDLQETGPYLWTVFENLNDYGKEKCLKKGAVQAIEYSAYEALKRKLEIAKAALELIKSNGITWAAFDPLSIERAASNALKEIEGEG